MEQVSEAAIGETNFDRTEFLYQEQVNARHVRADRMFAVLMIAQWIFAIGLALLVSPYAWAGKVREFHPHLYAAVFMGAGIAVFPVLLAVYRPGRLVTRHVIVASQMLWSALFIHLTGGRIETHFHVFGSLAFVAFSSTGRCCSRARWSSRPITWCAAFCIRNRCTGLRIRVVALPGACRVGSVRGHRAGVVVRHRVEEMRAAALRQAQVESLKESEEAKTAALEMVLKELQQPSLVARAR
jgi:hypothetical protein